MKRLRKVLSVIVATVLAVGIAAFLVGKGCGCDRPPQGWQVSVPTPAPADLMAGEWEGNWTSDNKSILKGWMKAVIEKTPEGDYKASFTSQNPLGTSDDKSVCVFHIGDKGAVWSFEGKENLGLLKGGTYKYKGTVDGETFICTYDSVFDKGTFRMTRKKAGTSTSAATAP